MVSDLSFFKLLSEGTFERGTECIDEGQNLIALTMIKLKSKKPTLVPTKFKFWFIEFDSKLKYQHSVTIAYLLISVVILLLIAVIVTLAVCKPVAYTAILYKVLKSLFDK